MHYNNEMTFNSNQGGNKKAFSYLSLEDHINCLRVEGSGSNYVGFRNAVRQFRTEKKQSFFYIY